MSRLFALQRNVSLANLSINDERPAPRERGVGAIWVSKEEVMARAEAFDSALRSFYVQVDANPVFGKSEYLAFKDPAKKAAHEAFVRTESDLILDWTGNMDEPKGTIKGYHQELKDMYIVGATELAMVANYENRLAALYAAYKTLGYNLTIKETKPADEVDQLGKYVKIAGVVLVVGAIGYVVFITQPMWMPALMGAVASRRAAA